MTVDVEQLQRENAFLRTLVFGAAHDLTGQIFNGRVVLGRGGKRGWRVRCEKGHETVARPGHLKKSGCRVCFREQLKVSGRFGQAVDMTGQVCGQWTVLGRAERGSRSKTGAYWHVRCSCGQESVVSGVSLRHALRPSRRCSTCARKLGLKGLHAMPQEAKVAAITAGHRARIQRVAAAPDTFGPKKRAVQQDFWNAVKPAPAFIFVDGSIGEWQMMVERGFRSQDCAAAADSVFQMSTFTERCRINGLTPPRVRRGVDITAECAASTYRAPRVPVVEYIKTRLYCRGKGPRAFGVAHLDFCCSLNTGSRAITSFLNANLLESGGVLAVTVSYRADDWLEVWKQLCAVVAPYGLTPWLQRTPYTDTGTPMLFATFQKSQSA